MLTTPPRDHPSSFVLKGYWLAGEGLTRLIDVLEAGGGAVRVVGGAVRNTLLAEPVTDIDLATTLMPQEVTSLCRAARLGVHPTGIEHGTVTVVAKGQPFEVTTLREDVATDGRRATVRYTTDFALDAARRDFTMNALYVDRAGAGTDYVGGYEDCMARRVRFIGEAGRRIEEDHLRILRFFRFNAVYGEGELDANGLAACRERRESLAALAAERVQHELWRLFRGARAADMLEIIAADGYLRPFIGRDLDVAAFKALRRAEASGGRTPAAVLALLALLSYDAAAFEEAAVSLRLSRRQRARAAAALKAAEALPPRSGRHVRRTLYDHGADAFCDGLVLCRAQGRDVEDLGRFIAEARRWQRPQLPVDGHDLLAQGGTAGPELGARLKHLEAAWRENDFRMDRERLLELDRAGLASRQSAG